MARWRDIWDRELLGLVHFAPYWILKVELSQICLKIDFGGKKREDSLTLDGGKIPYSRAMADGRKGSPDLLLPKPVGSACVRCCGGGA